MKKYDAILILGRGIDEQGEIPKFAKATIEKAVEMFQQKQTDKIIFAGKWSYNSTFIPPKTEAQAMAQYAIDLSLPKKAIILEEESEATVFNLCNVKKDILIPNNWTNIAIISSPYFNERLKLNTDMIFGDNIKYNIIDIDYPFQDPINLQNNEERKLAQAIEFHNNLKKGDDRLIYKNALVEIEQRGRKWSQ